jgi:uncharacterized protein (DUF2147 family)
MKYRLLILFCLLTSAIHAQQKADAIKGKWMSTDNNLEVEVFRENNEFKARLLWFDDSDDKTKPTNSRLDEKNHDKSLRSRKLIGIEVLHKLEYNADDDEWTDGIIYDSSSGKEWDAKAWINSAGLLKVRGYWHLSIFGETMSFKRIP